MNDDATMPTGDDTIATPVEPTVEAPAEMPAEEATPAEETPMA